MVQPVLQRKPLDREVVSYPARFRKSLEQPPVGNTLFGLQRKDRRPTPFPLEPSYTDWFLGKMNAVKNNCEKEAVCDHGLKHVEKAAQNGLVLKDMVQDLPQAKDQQYLFSDSSIVFTLLVHDLGYASDNLTWRDKHASNHQEEGVKVLHELIDTQADTTTHTLLTSHKAVYEKAILADTTAGLFPLLITTADKLDYFRKDRVAEIPAPQTYSENPYYFLASAVTNYYLHFNPQEKTLHYLVTLAEEDGLSSKAKQQRFEKWQQEVRTYFPHVFTLLENITHQAGAKLSMEVL